MKGKEDQASEAERHQGFGPHQELDRGDDGFCGD